MSCCPGFPPLQQFISHTSLWVNCFTNIPSRSRTSSDTSLPPQPWVPLSLWNPHSALCKLHSSTHTGTHYYISCARCRLWTWWDRHCSLWESLATHGIFTRSHRLLKGITVWIMDKAALGYIITWWEARGWKSFILHGYLRLQFEIFKRHMI